MTFVSSSVAQKIVPTGYLLSSTVISIDTESDSLAFCYYLANCTGESQWRWYMSLSRSAWQAKKESTIDIYAHNLSHLCPLAVGIWQWNYQRGKPLAPQETTIMIELWPELW